MNTPIRWLIKRDLQDVLAIEAASFRPSWDEAEFRRLLRARNMMGLVATDARNTPIGFVLYQLRQYQIRIVRLAVHPAYRRIGIGTDMVERLKDKLTNQRRDHMRVDVPESDLGAQLFLRACGFRAVRVERCAALADPNELQDAYVFTYRIGRPVEPGNRISEYYAS